VGDAGLAGPFAAGCRAAEAVADGGRPNDARRVQRRFEGLRAHGWRGDAQGQPDHQKFTVGLVHKRSVPVCHAIQFKLAGKISFTCGIGKFD
jgi:hypothetical protein